MCFGRVNGKAAVEIIPQLQQFISLHNKVQKYGLGETAIGVCKIIWEKNMHLYSSNQQLTCKKEVYIKKHSSRF